jgi:hypothetical protein
MFDTGSLRFIFIVAVRKGVLNAEARELISLRKAVALHPIP